MRAFIAIEVPLQTELMVVQDSLKTQSAKLRFVDKFHITLRFLGDVDDQKIELVKRRLEEIYMPNFSMKTGKVGTFPNVVWLGLEHNDEILHLKSEIDKALEGMGFKEDHRFHPHITLARVSFIKDKEGFERTVQATQTDHFSFNANSFILFKSTLTQDGPIYEKIKEIELKKISS